MSLAATSADRSALLGIGLMLLAMLMFSLNDALGKWLVATYSVGQILLLRSAASLVVMAPFVARSGTKPFRDAPQPRLQALRVLLSTLEIACFYAAVAYMPLADAMTFYLASPVYVTAFSALFLGEKVGAFRWTAVLIGFAGVLIALKPTGDSLSLASGIAVVGSIFYAFLMIVIRHLRETSQVVLATTHAGGALIFGAVLAPLNWVAVSLPDLPLLALLGIVSIAAIMLVNQSLRLAAASVVAPYQYTLIVWAILLGYIIFGDVPQWNTLAGAAVIVASGLFIFLREQRVSAHKDEPPALAER
jgi:drug/metabolite transporter (DMT)-like permease